MNDKIKINDSIKTISPLTSFGADCTAVMSNIQLLLHQALSKYSCYQSLTPAQIITFSTSMHAQYQINMKCVIYEAALSKIANNISRVLQIYNNSG